MKFLHLTAVAATALAVVAGTAGCGGNNETDHSAHAMSTVQQAPTAAVNPTSATSPGRATSPAIATSPAAVADVDCGPVTDAGGGTRTVTAVGTPAGRVGCTEAINVATKYATTVSNTDAQTIEGWQCNAQPDPATPSKCTKDGLIIGLRAS
ncbi:hypothetical protein ACFYO1_24100 [Nocardia sp. NPDC006044]|uniref:hypothetical protein n=1 Tax=Nocardia sp. NPDC006044 TaxID=3364306 RepID=UPI0036C18C0C